MWTNVMRFVWPAVTAVTQPSASTNPVVPTPVIHKENSSPIWFAHGNAGGDG